MKIPDSPRTSRRRRWGLLFIVALYSVALIGHLIVGYVTSYVKVHHDDGYISEADRPRRIMRLNRMHQQHTLKRDMAGGYYVADVISSDLLSTSSLSMPRVIHLSTLGGSVEDEYEHYQPEEDAPTIRLFELDNMQQQHGASSSSSINEEEYHDEKDLYPPNCVSSEPWHSFNFVNCNTFHEIDFATSIHVHNINYLAKGGTRSTWLLEHELQLEKVALKTLNWEDEKDFISHTFDLQRIDALISERLTQSPYVIDTYGYCGMSTLNEYAELGRFGHHYMEHVHNYTSMEKLVYARDISRGLADIHEIDLGMNHAASHQGISASSSVVHHDFSPKNLLLTADNRVKISDFNNAHLMRYDTEKKRSCYEFTWDHLCGKTIERTNRRSPEECLISLGKMNVTSKGKTKKEKKQIQRFANLVWSTPTTERTEVYHLGTVLHFILSEEDFPYRFEKQMTNDGSYYELSPKEVKDLILIGDKPPLPPEIEYSNDPAIRVIIRALKEAFTFHMKYRPSARSIANIIDEMFVKPDDHHLALVDSSSRVKKRSRTRRNKISR